MKFGRVILVEPQIMITSLDWDENEDEVDRRCEGGHGTMR